MSRTVEALKAEQQAWRDAGLCRACGAEVAEGKALCAEHLAYNRSYNREKRARRAAQSLCVQCGKPSDGGVLCAEHHAKKLAKEALAASRRRNLEAIRAAWRAKQAEAGLCQAWMCKAPIVPGAELCAKHVQPDWEHRERRAQRRRAVQRKKNAGLCAQCSWPKENDRLDRNVCGDCQAGNAERIRERDIERRVSGLCRCGRRRGTGYALCAKCRKVGRIRERRRVEKRIAAGRCARCPSAAVPGMSICEHHRQVIRETHARAERRAAGIVFKRAA